MEGWDNEEWEHDVSSSLSVDRPVRWFSSTPRPPTPPVSLVVITGAALERSRGKTHFTHTPHTHTNINTHHCSLNSRIAFSKCPSVLLAFKTLFWKFGGHKFSKSFISVNHSLHLDWFQKAFERKNKKKQLQRISKTFEDSLPFNQRLVFAGVFFFSYAHLITKGQFRQEMDLSPVARTCISHWTRLEPESCLRGAAYWGMGNNYVMAC